VFEKLRKVRVVRILFRLLVFAFGATGLAGFTDAFGGSHNAVVVVWIVTFGFGIFLETLAQVRGWDDGRWLPR
jgi:hypothetical protein